MLFESAEAPSVPLEDVQDVSNYVAAMSHGLRRLREDFPLSLRLIREIHKILLSKGRGSEKRPGEFRETQNWIGGTRPGNAAFVPPPPEQLMKCMGTLEKFLHREARGPTPSRENGPRACAIRNHSPLPGRKRTTGPLADYILAVRRWSDPRADSVPQFVFQDEPAEIL
jgi:Fic/DOC family